MYSKFFTVILISVLIEGKTMVWKPDVDFENIDNWTPRRKPCSNDRLIYPTQMNAQVQITVQSVSAAEIVLPRSGTIQLAETGSITLSDITRNTDECPGGDMTFKSQIKNSWLDSKSWYDFEGYNSGKSFIPHYDQIPCEDDTVVFPPGKSFIVQLPLAVERVKSITYDNEDLSTNRWNSILKENPLTFQSWIGGSVPAVQIQRDSKACSKEEICPCHSSQLPYELCLNEKPKCPFTQCLHPVQPLNHCCEICGSIIKVKIDNTFNKRSFQDKIKNAIKQYGTDGVDYYIGASFNKRNEKYIQVVMVEQNEYDGASVQMGKYVYEIIKYAMDYEDRPILLVSGIPWKGPNAAAGGWEAFVMMIVVGLVITGIVMVYHPPPFLANRFRQFEFARFDNRTREGSLLMGVSQLTLHKDFDNPMYGKMEKSDDEEENLTETEVDEDDTEPTEKSEKEE